MPQSIVFSAAGNSLSRSLARATASFLRSPWSLVLAIALAFLLNSATLPLTDVDEGAFAEATREMVERGNLVSPTLNDLPRHDKPILIYWAQAAAIHFLGQTELAFRLPSLVAAVLWLLAIRAFCRRHGDREEAQAAALVMALSLMVGIIAKAAIADALLNLFLCLALFGIYDYFRAARSGRPPSAARRILLAGYAAMGLAFLTKGPLALLFPLLIGGAFLASLGAWRICLAMLSEWRGWLLFLAIVAPWHVLVYLDQGDAFFRGFFVHHNFDRYTSTFEGHGGHPFYYLAILPVVLLPFTGWLFAIASRAFRPGRAGNGAETEAAPGLHRFLLIWFAAVFVFFSWSRTQLPHYILYGCTPLFILLARHRPVQQRRLLAFAPGLLFMFLLALLPLILGVLAGRLDQAFKNDMAEALAAQLDTVYAGLAALALLAMLAIAAWRRLPIWQGLILAGFLQAFVIAGLLLPRVLAVTQAPVRELALLARQSKEPVVAWRAYLPTFSLYRQAATPARLPRTGELVLTRRDRVGDLEKALAPQRVQAVYSRGHVVLLRVLP